MHGERQAHAEVALLVPRGLLQQLAEGHLRGSGARHAPCLLPLHGVLRDGESGEEALAQAPEVVVLVGVVVDALLPQDHGDRRIRGQLLRSSPKEQRVDLLVEDRGGAVERLRGLRREALRAALAAPRHYDGQHDAVPRGLQAASRHGRRHALHFEEPLSADEVVRLPVRRPDRKQPRRGAQTPREDDGLRQRKQRLHLAHALHCGAHSLRRT
mmetsp:Transcript_80973/g.234725  ORF Transcript_80973/g.234725 Transcript_80973/m.234725 type:complete len:213 (-) Transcript_80973:596-1234(-)